MFIAYSSAVGLALLLHVVQRIRASRNSAAAEKTDGKGGAMDDAENADFYNIGKFSMVSAARSKMSTARGGDFPSMTWNKRGGMRTADMDADGLPSSDTIPAPDNMISH